jgi:hypothetical protein
LNACPTNWATRPIFDGRFVLATPANGKPGSSSTFAWTDYVDPGHVHTYSGSISVDSKGFVWGGGAYRGIASPGAQAVSGGLAKNTEPVVPFVTLLACEKQAMGDSKTLPLGLTMFLSASTCPNSWGSTPAAPGRFFVGMAGGGTQGAAFGGEPIDPNAMTRKHPHWINGSINITEYDTDLSQTWENLHLGKKGISKYTVLSTSGEVSIPYLMLEACTFIGS